MDIEGIASSIKEGRTALGIEFGSTRIKAVLVDETFAPIASGCHDWENRLEDGVWTYHIDSIVNGLQSCYRSLCEDVKAKYGVEVETLGSIGVSAMMHGYMAFDSDGALLAPFRTWRNTCTGPAAAELSELFAFNIPQRWSIAHLYQAILNGEPHVPSVAFFTTLAGFVHWKLTGRKVLGVGDASGMFPIDSTSRGYDQKMLDAFEKHIASRNYPWRLRDLLPEILCAGEPAGNLTEEGAALLDPTGKLKAGVPLCPPEGDAGTGMTATCAVAPRTGNVSAGTSIFAMIVLEKQLSGVYPEIDMVTTPDGYPVAMVHCNNCSSDVDAWIRILREFAELIGCDISKPKVYDLLYEKALEGSADCGGLVSFNYFSGEPVAGLDAGRPLFMRTPAADFTLANFMRTNLYGAVATLKLGMNILLEKEKVVIDKLVGHGGFFKTPVVGQRVMASLGTPVSVMETAGEGGAWGIALLASYLSAKGGGCGLTLADFLDQNVFAGLPVATLNPDPQDVKGFDVYMERFSKCLPVEKSAVDNALF